MQVKLKELVEYSGDIASIPAEVKNGKEFFMRKKGGKKLICIWKETNWFINMATQQGIKKEQSSWVTFNDLIDHLTYYINTGNTILIKK
jgi:hypothetical protein